MRLIKQYILSAIIPALMVLIAGFFQMPSDCNQCILLLLVGSGLILMALLVLNTSYFLMLIQMNDKLLRLIFSIVSCYVPTILLTGYLFSTYYNPDSSAHTDLCLSAPSIIAALAVATWTFYLNHKEPFSLKKKKKPAANKT